MKRYRVVHVTEYRYKAPVTSSYGQVCLLPRATAGQVPRGGSVTIEPGPSDSRERSDYFGNRVGYFHVDRTHVLLRVAATSEVEVDDTTRDVPLEANRPLAWTRRAMTELDGDDRLVASMLMLDSARATVDDAVRAYAAPSFEDRRPMIECLADLVHRINRDFDFEVEATKVTSTIDDLFETGAGVCQDFAHLAVACLRASGLPGRYVSGYLETDPPPGKPKLQGADASHAWAATLIPGVGWIDLDPTNDQFVNDRYVTVAFGRDYNDITPVKGVIYSDSAAADLDVSVDVIRLA